MARQYLRITPEVTWGAYAGSGGIIVQLDQNNAFTMRPAPVPWVIRSAGGFNRRVQTGASKTSVQGALNMLCYGSQMATMAPLICATSANVLGSMTLDHAIVMEDSGATHVYRRYLGVKASQAQLTAGEQNQLMRLQLQLIGQQPATITSSDFAEPAATDYPSDAPYVFEMGSGALTYGSGRVAFEQFDVTIKNMLDPRFMASQYLTYLKYCGRDVDFSMRFPYVTTIDRSNYETVTTVAASITFTNGGHSMALNFNSQNITPKVEDDLALDKLHLQSVDGSCYFDPSAGTPNDFTLTAS